MSDFENKAIEYYTTVLEKRKNYYKLNKATSNEQSKLYHQKIMATPEMRDRYLAKRREIYKIKKEKEEAKKNAVI